MMMPNIVILAGGIASRLYPVTKTVPKAMIEIAGKPFISHQLELIKANGIKDAVVCAGYLGEEIQKYVGNGKAYGINVRFSFDGEKLLGTAGAIKKALPLLGEDFAVMYGDSYLTADFKEIYNFFLKSRKKGLMTVFKNDGKYDKSNIVFSNSIILKYDKKNTASDMSYIDYGLSFFKKEAFNEISDNQICDLADLCSGLVQSGQMAGYEVKERFYEIGSFEGLEETKRYLEKMGGGDGRKT